MFIAVQQQSHGDIHQLITQEQTVTGLSPSRFTDSCHIMKNRSAVWQLFEKLEN